MNDIEDEHQIWGDVVYRLTLISNKEMDEMAGRTDYPYFSGYPMYVAEDGRTWPPYGEPALTEKPSVSPDLWKAFAYILLFYAVCGLIWWVV